MPSSDAKNISDAQRSPWILLFLLSRAMKLNQSPIGIVLRNVLRKAHCKLYLQMKFESEMHGKGHWRSKVVASYTNIYFVQCIENVYST